MGRKTKKQIQNEQLDAKVVAERKRLLFVLKKTDKYSQVLDPLIETYLQIYRVNEIMYDRWSEAGFPETKRYTNKAGATNQVKHPLAMQFDIWSDKKMKALERLGMTTKSLSTKVITGGSTINEQTGTVESQAQKPVDELAEHRKKWRANAN